MKTTVERVSMIGTRQWCHLFLDLISCDSTWAVPLRRSFSTISRHTVCLCTETEPSLSSQAVPDLTHTDASFLALDHVRRSVVLPAS